MPDWLASFHRPHMTTEKFIEMKAKYVAEHGYTITVPDLRDIFIINIEKPMNAEEVKSWKKKDWAAFSEERLYDIGKMKARRKEKFLSMLASPTPHIINNAGSIMTSIDDAQDALGTLAFIGMLAIKAAPRLLGGILGGPVGWTATAAETLNTIQHLGFKKRTALSSQTAMYKAQHASTTSRKNRVISAAKTMKWMPTQGRVVEAAQVTKDVFGIGLCLGPIVGFAIEAVTGPYRRITGARVNVKLPMQDHSIWTKYAQRQSRSGMSYMGSGLQTEPEEVMMMTMANYLSRQELSVGMKVWSALDNVENVDEIELLAPIPTNVLTLEVMEEAGIGKHDRIGWPHNSKPWALSTDLVNELDGPCKGFQNDFIELHKTDWLGYVFGALNNDATCYTMETAEGEGKQEYSYTAAATVAQVLTQFILYPSAETPAEKMQAFADKIDIWEAMEIKPDIRLIMDFCAETGIELVPFET